jgi:predicted amidophosphoribosyltransferase
MKKIPKTPEKISTPENLHLNWIFVPVLCPTCKRKVPYAPYCCECGQRFSGQLKEGMY